MSIIVALISNRDGVVASDGREFDTVRFENDMAIEPSRVISDGFDKTFTINKGKIIGAYCGLMSFGGATIAEHVAQIVSNIDMAQCGIDFPSIVEQIEIGIKTELSQIDDKEVVFSRRKIDLLFVAGFKLTRNRLNIASIQFLPVNTDILTKKNFDEAGSLKLSFYVFGDDRAQKAAFNILNGNQVNNKNARFLNGFAQNAIRTGIDASGPHSYSPENACGGKIFTQKTQY